MNMVDMFYFCFYLISICSSSFFIRATKKHKNKPYKIMKEMTPYITNGFVGIIRIRA